MAWHMKDPGAFRSLIEERSAGRELGRLKHSDFAKAASVSEPFASNVIGGTKGCSRGVALAVVDRLGFPYVPLGELFEER